jgi:hypothetical protein
MKINRGLLAGLVAGVSVLAVSSCSYDPYYSGTSYSGSYGYGNGYGSSGFSTSVFVSTGNPRWGYDPYAGAYYDYTRRAYYDPYLYGYYPVGFRPRYVYGAPHPGGWVSGRSYCPPPSRIRSHSLTNYSNRAERYRSLNTDWSRNVRVSAPTDHRREGYGGRETRQHGYQGSRESAFPQRQESFPSRDGSFQRSGGERDRGSFGRGAQGSRGFTPDNSRVTAPQPMVRTRDDGRSGGFSGRQAPPQIERPAPQQRFERPAPQQRFERPAPPQRMERPVPPQQPQQARPEIRRGGNPETRGEDPRGRGRGIRGLGEG